MVMGRNLLLGAGSAAVAAGSAAWANKNGMGSMADYKAAVAELRRIPPTAPETRDLIRYASLAPNGHNTQPWLFRPGKNGVAILPDFGRRTPVVDPDDHHVFVSLGCAAENLAIAAGAAGRAGDIEFDPAGDGTVLVRFGCQATSCYKFAQAETLQGACCDSGPHTYTQFQAQVREGRGWRQW